MWRDHILFIHSSVDGHLGSFHLLAVVTSAAVTICVQVFVWVPVFSSLGSIPGSGMARSYDNFMFNFWGSHLIRSTLKRLSWAGDSAGSSSFDPIPCLQGIYSSDDIYLSLYKHNLISSFQTPWFGSLCCTLSLSSCSSNTRLLPLPTGSQTAGWMSDIAALTGWTSPGWCNQLPLQMRKLRLTASGFGIPIPSH